jgi:hypothetical protein
VQLWEHFAQPKDITFQYSCKEFLSNAVEERAQALGYLFPLCCGFEDRKPPIARIDIAREQTA